MDKKNQVLMSVLGVFALVIVTVGVSYAFFSYTRTGTTTSTITSGEISFSYIEGASATLENAFPVADAVGEAEEDHVYTFDVSTTYTGSAEMKYNVSFVKNNEAGTTQVKKYIFGANGVVEKENGEPKYEMQTVPKTFFEDNEVKYQLKRSIDGAAYTVESGSALLSTIFTDDTAVNPNGNGVVLKNVPITSGANHKYELRIWLNGDNTSGSDVDYSNTTKTDDNTTEYEDAQISVGGYNGKSYSLKVKVDAAATNTYTGTSS